MRGFRGNYPAILLVVFLVTWVILAVSPNYRSVWIAENILTVLFVGLLILTYKKFRFSNFSYTLFFVFMILHSIGGHYSYTEMPLFDLIQDKFDLSRNHYDRVIHFLFGLMFFIPVYEFISKKLKLKDFWGFFLAFLILIALKGIFEVIEYGHLLITRGSEIIGANYLGMQGDQWDAQKDIFIGILGSIVAWSGVLIKGKLRK
ncbi:DUF2238 domain-containing protein [Candidatus Parvarchaeota archaeon]|nr:MAG: DUF2238 domain-containing protein [Candidatus Parvarchaeota archaeon]